MVLTDKKWAQDLNDAVSHRCWRVNSIFRYHHSWLYAFAPFYSHMTGARLHFERPYVTEGEQIKMM